jgi:RNA polymerase II elongation factor ELL
LAECRFGDRVTDKVRQQTMVAKQQHMERQGILDQPPINVPGKNAKRTIPCFGIVLKKKTAPSDQLHLASPSTHLSRKVSPLPHNPTPSKASSDVRRRLVHFLATAPCIADDVVRMVGGSITIAAYKDLLALLHDVSLVTPLPLFPHSSTIPKGCRGAARKEGRLVSAFVATQALNLDQGSTL